MIVRARDDSYTVQLTKEMINIPSVTGEEEALGHYIKNKLESYGMDTELHYATDKRPNVYGTMQGEKVGKG